MDTDREGRPWLSWLIMTFMAGIFFYFRYDPLAAAMAWDWWVYYPSAGLTPGVFLSIFNHADWLHLGGNLLYFWTFAPTLELSLGRRRFLLLFVFLGLFGNLIQGLMTQYFFTELSGFGVVGASGAISGLMALFLLRFPTSRIKAVWVIFSPLQGVIRNGLLLIPSLLAIVIWVAFQVLAIGAKILAGWWDFTAYGAHFGGLAGGLLLGYGLKLHREGRVFRWRERTRRRFEKGDWMGAWESMEPLLASSDPEDLTLAARISLLAEQKGQAMDLYRRAIQISWRSQDPLGAASSYAEALRLFPHLSFEAPMQYELALALDRAGLHQGALRAIESYRSLYPETSRAALLLLRQARLEEGLDPVRARSLYAEHLSRYPGSPFETMVRSALRGLDGLPQSA